ncbi:Golgi-associated plant pathogenesis-related protein 1 [Thelohanellus kitauei]|uniref:Golgi-associated plant pathogenesis-related protein 1 n=1 Tax=Thelohanellus kitauei TaxID=669202 RepID=A0A0C2MGW7_THEKT|nr:Golgi-associated plant pathogenesis-related protein 1 [Thelohanellus kitauei]
MSDYAIHTNIGGERVTNLWYNESNIYDYSQENQQPDVLHFTQVVWFQTEKFGIHYEERDGNTYVVARYFPPGNIKGQFMLNVLRPMKKDSDLMNPESNAQGMGPPMSTLYGGKTLPRYIENITSGHACIKYRSCIPGKF